MYDNLDISIYQIHPTKKKQKENTHSNDTTAGDLMDLILKKSFGFLIPQILVTKCHAHQWNIFVNVISKKVIEVITV